MNKRQRKKKLTMSNKPIPRKVGNGWTDMEIIEEMARCTSCSSGFHIEPKKDLDEIEFLVENLSTLPYVESQYINLLFSNGLTTGEEESTLKLSNFLYRRNIQGITNLEIIQQAIIHSKRYGKCGIRWLSEKDGIILVPHDHYVTIVEDDGEYKGFKRPYYYAVSADPDKPISLGKIEIDRDEFERTHRLIDREGKVIIVMPDEFINLRNDPSKENGVSVFHRDKLRLKLICSVYLRLNYDIEYDGPGRIIFWMNDEVSNGSIELSAGEIIDRTNTAQNDRLLKFKKEIEALANEIKNSGSDNVVLASSLFKDKIDHLPRVTKATEFLEWLMSKEGTIVAQCFSISPALIELGDVSGNVSMDKILDHGMLNDIVPEREKIAVQISSVLSNKLGLPKVYFDKYELKSQMDKSAEIYKEMLSVAQCIATATKEGDKMALAIMNHAMQTLGQKEEFDIDGGLHRYSTEELEVRNESIDEETDKGVRKVDEEVDVGKIR